MAGGEKRGEGGERAKSREKRKREKREDGRSKDPIVWQGLLVKLENKLQRTGQEEARAGRKTETIARAFVSSFAPLLLRDAISMHPTSYYFISVYKVVLIRPGKI